MTKIQYRVLNTATYAQSVPFRNGGRMVLAQVMPGAMIVLDSKPEVDGWEGLKVYENKIEQPEVLPEEDPVEDQKSEQKEGKK